MAQFNTSTFITHLQVFIVVFVFILFINGKHVSAINENYEHEESSDLKQFTPEIDELNQYDVDSRVPRSEINRLKLHNRFYYPKMSYDYILRHAAIPTMPYFKRGIPIELQKALYAHGIVGRRR